MIINTFVLNQPSAIHSSMSRNHSLFLGPLSSMSMFTWVKSGYRLQGTFLYSFCSKQLFPIRRSTYGETDMEETRYKEL